MHRAKLGVEPKHGMCPTRRAAGSGGGGRAPEDVPPASRRRQKQQRGEARQPGSKRARLDRTAGHQLVELQASDSGDASRASQASPTVPVAGAARAPLCQSAPAALEGAAPPSGAGAGGAGSGGQAAAVQGCVRLMRDTLRQWQGLVAKLQQSLDRELQRMDELCAAMDLHADAASHPADAPGGSAPAGALPWPAPQKGSAGSVLPPSPFEAAAGLGASSGDEGGLAFEDEATAALSARLLQLAAQASAPLAAAAPDASGPFEPPGGQQCKEELAAVAVTAAADSVQGQALAAALAGAAPAPAATAAAEVAAQEQASAWGLPPLGRDEASVQSMVLLLRLATLAAMPPLEVGQASQERR